MRKLIAAMLLVALGGCSATFQERHHFATVNAKTGEVQNIFRVTVKGEATMTNARYIAGFYDERAVDLFFNEVQAAPLTDDERRGGAPQIFKTVSCAELDDEACRAKQDQVLRMVPVGSNLGKSGSFVMILSTNANAIADTIGGFAENKVVMNSILYLATREDREKAAAITATAGIARSSRNSAFTAITDVAAVDANTSTARQAKWLSVLRTAAAGISPEAPPSFATLEEAKAWFASVDRRGSQ